MPPALFAKSNWQPTVHRATGVPPLSCTLPSAVCLCPACGAASPSPLRKQMGRPHIICAWWAVLLMIVSILMACANLSMMYMSSMMSMSNVILILAVPRLRRRGRLTTAHRSPSKCMCSELEYWPSVGYGDLEFLVLLLANRQASTNLGAPG